MTQAKATHFHSFWTRKILAPTESIDDFKEVTAAEKAKLEAADAAWERPPQSFIDAWNTRADYTSMNKAYKFGQYNEETGYFELNTILDIDYPEAREIMQQSGVKLPINGLTVPSPHGRGKGLRTLMPQNVGDILQFSTAYIAYDSTIEVLNVLSIRGDHVRVQTDLVGAMYPHARLHTIMGVISPWANFTLGGEHLKNVKIGTEGLADKTVTIKSKDLSLESIQYTIDNATKTITLALTPEVYEKIPEEMFAQAADGGFVTLTEITA